MSNVHFTEVIVVESKLSRSLKTAGTMLGLGLLYGGAMALAVFGMAAGVKASKRAFGDDVFDAEATSVVRIEHYHQGPGAEAAMANPSQYETGHEAAVPV